MNGEQIERTDSAKILGVTISADLTWNAHVNNTVSKASKRLYMLYQLKRAGVDQHDEDLHVSNPTRTRIRRPSMEHQHAWLPVGQN